MTPNGVEHAWPWWRVALWAFLLAATCAWKGPLFLASLRPLVVQDLFQEWASARYYFQGTPVYAAQETAITHYRGSPRDPGEVFNEYNAHLPAAVLLTLPLAFLDYPDAFLVWDLLSLVAFAVSLALVVYQLPLRISPWALLPLLTLLLFCNPFRQQLNQGQLNLLLLLLLTGAWAADRSGHPWWAGALLGTAAAVKIFPAFVFLYFVARRDWRAVAAGGLAVLVWTGLTAAVLGPSCYRDYVENVLPHVATYRDSWINFSLTGLWYKLLAGTAQGGHTSSLWHNPPAATLTAVVSALAIVAVVAVVCARARSVADRDRAFALCVTAMLLVSPITWDHYFVLLLLPLVVFPALGRGLRPRPNAGAIVWRVAFFVALAVLWAPPVYFWWAFRLPVTLHGWHEEWHHVVGQPWQTLAVFSFHTYALLGLFLLGLAAARVAPVEAPGLPSPTSGEAPPSVEEGGIDRRLFGAPEARGQTSAAGE
jgi:hypothetical protein